MPNYEYQCTECDSITVEMFPMATKPDDVVCACGGKAEFKISTPNLMIKEAYRDGYKRDGWDKMKEASAMNKEIGKQKDEKSKKQIADQIKKMGVRVRQ